MILDDISEDLGCNLTTPFLAMPQIFLGYSFVFRHVFFKYSLSIPYIFFRLPLSPIIEFHTVVETMLRKLSSFKRASRSLAKTGFPFWVFFGVYVRLCLLFVFLEALEGPLGAIGCPLGAFWVTFCHFLGDYGILLDATHSRAKTYILRFGRSQVGTCSSTFPDVDFRL